MQELLVQIASHDLFIAVVSGLIGVAVSTAFYLRYEARKEKKEAARLLFAYRYDLKGDEFSRAINQASVVFHKDKSVLRLLNTFNKEVREGKGTDETMKSIFRAVCRSARIDISQIDDEFLMTPFNTRK